MNPALIIQAIALAADFGGKIAAQCGKTKASSTLDDVSEIAAGLTGAVGHLTQVTELVNRAITEGRDLTEEELKPYREASEKALAGWKAVAGPRGGLPKGDVE